MLEQTRGSRIEQQKRRKETKVQHAFELLLLIRPYLFVGLVFLPRLIHLGSLMYTGYNLLSLFVKVIILRIHPVKV